MGKCGSIAHMTVGILRRSGLAPEDYVLLRLEDHTLGIFRYNETFYMIDNNRVYPISEAMLEKPTLVFGFYHEDEATADRFSIDATFLTYEDNVSLTRWLTSLYETAESDIYQSNLSEIDRAYLEHRIDVPRFDLYLQASIEEPNVKNLAEDLETTSEILSWVKSNIELTPRDDHVQLADETIVFGKGSDVDRAVLISSLLFFHDIETTIHQVEKSVLLGVEGRYYSMENLQVEKLPSDAKLLGVWF